MQRYLLLPASSNIRLSCLLSGVWQVEGSPVRAVSLGSTAGGGNPPSKVEEFKAALVALGEGHLIGEENAEQPEGATRSNAATVRVTAKLPCDLQVRHVRHCQVIDAKSQ